MLQVDYGSKPFQGHNTPFYYYDMDLLQRTLHSAAEASRRYGIKVHYAMKANSEQRILEAVATAGFGVDSVSGNEILEACRCGFDPSGIFFAGVGKTDSEIDIALSKGIGAFNCESVEELEIIAGRAAAHGLVAPVQIRVNPGVDAHTHKYVTTGLAENKFGVASVDFERAAAFVKGAPSLRFVGLQFHVGSQILDVEEVFRDECYRAAELVDFFEERGLRVSSIDMGGGLGVDYEDPDENPVPDFETWFRTIDRYLPRRSDQEVHVEPGRALVAQCGSLISRVVYVKKGVGRNFLILDGGMNNLIRPALYGAYHKIENLTAHYVREDEEKSCVYDVVGPICESADVFATGRQLRRSLRGDLVAIRSAGAYGSVMSSAYNMRGFAGAVFSDQTV